MFFLNHNDNKNDKNDNKNDNKNDKNDNKNDNKNDKNDNDNKNDNNNKNDNDNKNDNIYINIDFEKKIYIIISSFLTHNYLQNIKTINKNIRYIVSENIYISIKDYKQIFNNIIKDLI